MDQLAIRVPRMTPAIVECIYGPLAENLGPFLSG